MINLGDAVFSFRVDDAPLFKTVGKIGPKVRGASREAEKGLDGFRAGLSRIKRLATGVGLVFVGWKVIQVLKDAAKAAIAFGKEFANVATLINTQTPIGVKQLKILRQQILDLRPELGSATELTKGLYQALSAGAAPAGAVRLVGEAALFAKAGLTDTLTAVDLMTTILNAYGKSAEDAAAVSSTLFKTIELGKTTGQELAGALGRVIPVAASLNVSLPELNSALATMTKSGLSTAEAVTSLRAILKTFISPESAKRFEELGLTAADLRDIITKDGLNAALKVLGERLGGSTAKTAELFREQEAQVGVFTLLGAGANEYRRILDELIVAEREATATTIAADKQFDTLDERFKAIAVTIQKEFIIAFENMSPAIEAALVSFGALGASGQNLRIILNAVAFSIIFLTQVFIFWKQVIETAILAVFSLRLALAEFVASNRTLSKVFGILTIGIGQLRKTVASLKGSIKTDIDLIEKLEIQLAKMNQELKLISEVGPRAKKTLDDLGGAAGKMGIDFEAAGIKTVAALRREVGLARELALALIDAGAPISELNQAIDRLAEAETALADAQAAVLGGAVKLKAEVPLVTEAFEIQGTKLPPIIEKYNNLREALRALGIEGSAALKERLVAAEAALEAIRVAAEVGLASQVDVLAGEIEVMEVRIELWRALGRTIDEEYLDKLEAAKEKLAELRGEGEADLTALGKTYQTVTGVISQALGAAIQASILGQKSLGAALKQTLAEELSIIAKRNVIKAIEDIADGIRALAMGNFAAAGQFFLAAAQHGAVAAAAGLAARAFAQPAQVTREVGGERRTFTTEQAEEPQPLVIERRLQAGGIVSRPTLALLGEQAPAIKEAVIPFRTDRVGEPGPEEGVGLATPIQIFIEGMIADDTLFDFVEKLSNAVKHNDLELQASDSFNVTQRS